jgi:hypothetical protein
MGRNNLELARNSLLIENIKNASKATGLPIVQNAYMINVASELLHPPLFQNFSELFEIHKNFGREIADTPNNPNAPFVLRIVLRIDTEHHRSIHIRTLLKFLDGRPP